jgi:peptide/nickel transport system substrate-binding protein
MDIRLYDRVRRNATGVEVDHIESFAQGRISRREFVTRGSVLGLSLPFMGAIIAACGSSSKGSSSASTAAGASNAKIKQGGTMRVATQKPGGPLDPVKMADLGTYTQVVTAFEYLCGPGEGAGLAPMLAEKWTPDATGGVWTFNLRKGVKWHDGKAFTAKDVVASLDRLAGSNLKAYIDAGSAKATDDNTVTVTLKSPDGQFPYQLSIYNPQSVITPEDFVAGSTLDGKKNGTGAFKLEKYDPATGATFVRNDGWWGGKPYLDKVEYIFSDDIATQISGLQGGAADAIVQFSVVGGEALLTDANLTVEAIRGAAHRQIWMNTREGDFTDKRVRQAIALSLDRKALVDTVLKGKGDIGNDHPIAPVYAYFDKSQAQRQRDVAKAKQLLADAGKAGLKKTLYAPKLQEIPELAQLVQNQLKEAGLDITLNVESTDTFYDQWCKVYDSKTAPAGCDGGQEFGIVDYGNRGTPDVYLVKAYATGEWNSAHYISEPFNAAVKEYQASLDTSGRAKAMTKIQTIANEDVPYAIPYFYNSLTAYSKKVGGIVSTGLGHYYLGKAGFLA